MSQLLVWENLDRLQRVVASACQAGVPAIDAPDELLGIGYGLLHAGAQSVISPMWDVNDTPTALLMAKMYDELGRGQDPGRAWRSAQLWMRDVSNATLTTLSVAKPTGHGLDAGGWLPNELVAHIAITLQDADPADRPFRHPIDWAAFTYLGL